MAEMENLDPIPADFVTPNLTWHFASWPILFYGLSLRNGRK